MVLQHEGHKTRYVLNSKLLERAVFLEQADPCSQVMSWTLLEEPRSQMPQQQMMATVQVHSCQKPSWVSGHLSVTFPAFCLSRTLSHRSEKVDFVSSKVAAELRY